jgi:hypothetical protein
MFGLTAATRIYIYLYRGVCDMRKSFDGLCGIVRSDLGDAPCAVGLPILRQKFIPVKLIMAGASLSPPLITNPLPKSKISFQVNGFGGAKLVRVKEMC